MPAYILFPTTPHLLEPSKNIVNFPPHLELFKNVRGVGGSFFHPATGFGALYLGKGGCRSPTLQNAPYTI